MQGVTHPLFFIPLWLSKGFIMYVRGIASFLEKVEKNIHSYINRHYITDYLHVTPMYDAENKHT